MAARGSQQAVTEWTTLPLCNSRDDHHDAKRRAESEQTAGKFAGKEMQPRTNRAESASTTAELFQRTVSPLPRHTSAQPAVHVTPALSKPEPPTAKVAPLLGPHSAVHRSHVPSRDAYSPSCSPVASRAGQLGTSSPTFDCRREKLQLLERDPFMSQDSPVKRIWDSATGISADKIRSLMSLITEKSQIIDRQKQTILRLQRECVEKDLQLRVSASSRALNEARSTGLDNKSTSLTDLASTLEYGESERLSRKLDAAYYDLDKANSKTMLLQEKLKSKEKVVTELELILEGANKKKTDLSQQLEKLQGYLGHMPTMEEHYGLQEQLQEMKEQKALLGEELKAREYELDLLAQSMKEKEELLISTETELSELTHRQCDLEHRAKSQDRIIAELRSENSKLKSEFKDVQKELSEYDVHRTKELHAMRERHKQRFAEATAKLREQHKLLARRAKQLESQLTRNSDAMSALTNELQIRQGTIGELRVSMEDLIAQNTALLENNLSLKEANSEVKLTLSNGQLETVHQLAQELSVCVDEFESLVALVTSMLEGRDPNTSTLLGIKPGATALPVDASYEQRLEQVRQFREDIDRLRTLVADHFAKQVASDCAVQ